MPTGYTRQSSAEIVDGQVANAADFNNEFNLLETAFSTSGHDHSGSNGQGPQLSITNITGALSSTVLTGTLTGTNGGITSTNADPTTANGGSAYAVGSIWVNASNKNVFICASNGASTAIWTRLNARVTSSNPAVTDDVASGYMRGAVWVTTGLTPPTVYVCADNTAGAAVWLPLAVGRTQNSDASNPGVSDDTTLGYRVGSMWVNRTTNDLYVCASNTTGSALWININTVDINGRTAATPAPGDEVIFYDTSAAGNRKVAFWGIFEDGGGKSTSFTASNGVFYSVNCTNCTITLPTSASTNSSIVFALAGPGPFTLSAPTLLVNAVASVDVPGFQTLVLTYTGTTWGYV